jgi:prephenate dehydrogenase
MFTDRVQQVAILGTGLIGGSIGLALRSNGFAGRIVGHARRQATLDCAVERGCIDQGFLDPADACCGSDLVVLAVPVGAMRRLIEMIGAIDDGHFILTDAGSTKRTIVDQARQLLHDPSRYVPAHPMAGTEQQGPQAAFPELFRGKPVIITAGRETSPEARTVVESFWQFIGMRVIHMAPDEADRAAARISHLPHAVAALLVDLAAEKGGLEVASTGFADVTRVASGGAELWADIFCENAEAVGDVIDEWIERMQQFRDHVLRHQHERLVDMLDRAKAARDGWLKTRDDLRRNESD